MKPLNSSTVPGVSSRLFAPRAATVLVPHDIFPIGNMTGFPTLKDKIPAEQWQDKRVVWDARVKLLTSQGPGTAIDFGLKIIDLLVGREKAHEVASQLVMAAGDL